MGTDINFRKHLGRTYGTYIGLPAFDPSAAAYFTATGITGATQQTAIDNLVKGLKADGLWSKMKAVYPFVTDNRNLIDYSEDFGNAYWTKFQTTVTSNSTTAPNGTFTADTINEGIANGQHVVNTTNNSLQSNSIYTFSTYLKYVDRKIVGLDFYYNASPYSALTAIFDLSNGTIYSQAGTNGATLINSSITSVGNGWYRVTVSGQVGAYTTNVISQVSLFDDSYNRSYTGTNKTVQVWGAQLELGSTATTYQPIATTQQAFISSQFKYNLVNPVDSDAAFRLVFNGGWTHSSNGATPNGANGFADTKLAPSSVLTQDSTHLSFYSRTNISASQSEIGAALQGDPRRVQMELRYLGNFASDLYNYSTGRVSATNSDSLGYYVASRLNSTTHKAFKNNIQLGSTNTGASGLISAITHPIYIGASNEVSSAQYYSSKQVAFSTIGDGLTDTEAANLYTRVQAFNQALSRQVGVPIVSDADAQAFLNSVDITDITQANAINTLVTDLKAQGLWTKMKAIYPFVGGTASTHKYNLKDPRDLDAAYRLVFNGGWTHSSTGATPNGTNGYADTKLVPSSVLAQNSASIGAYLRTNNTGDYCDIGSSNNPTYNSGLYLFYNVTANKDFSRNNNDSGAGGTTTASSGFIVNKRNTSTNMVVLRNNANPLSNGNPTTGRSTSPILISAMNRGGTIELYSNRQTAFNFVSDGLTDTEATALYNAVNTYQVALSRQVP